MISPARWSRRWKIALETPPEISWRIFWCNKIFWEFNFQHPMKPEIDRKWRNAIGQLGVWTNEHTPIWFWKFFVRVISLLFWSCQLTGKKKFEFRLKNKRNCLMSFTPTSLSHVWCTCTYLIVWLGFISLLALMYYGSITVND